MLVFFTLLPNLMISINVFIWLIRESVPNNSFDSEQAVPDPIVLAEFDLAARTTASLEITVEFVNSTVDQNAYQGFSGKGQGEKCYRQVIAYVAEKTESA